jgi:hypothetical protein
MEVFDYELNSYLQSLDDSDRISGMIDRIEGCIETATEIMATKNIDPDVLCPEDYRNFATDALQEAFWGKHFRFHKLHDLDEEQLRTIDTPTRAEIAELVDDYLGYLMPPPVMPT